MSDVPSSPHPYLSTMRRSPLPTSQTSATREGRSPLTTSTEERFSKTSTPRSTASSISRSASPMTPLTSVDTPQLQRPRSQSQSPAGRSHHSQRLSPSPLMNKPSNGAVLLSPNFRASSPRQPSPRHPLPTMQSHHHRQGSSSLDSLGSYRSTSSQSSRYSTSSARSRQSMLSFGRSRSAKQPTQQISPGSNVEYTMFPNVVSLNDLLDKCVIHGSTEAATHCRFLGHDKVTFYTVTPPDPHNPQQQPLHSRAVCRCGLETSTNIVYDQRCLSPKALEIYMAYAERVNSSQPLGYLRNVAGKQHRMFAHFVLPYNPLRASQDTQSAVPEFKIVSVFQSIMRTVFPSLSAEELQAVVLGNWKRPQLVLSEGPAAFVWEPHNVEKVFATTRMCHADFGPRANHSPSSVGSSSSVGYASPSQVGSVQTSYLSQSTMSEETDMNLRMQNLREQDAFVLDLVWPHVFVTPDVALLITEAVLAKLIADDPRQPWATYLQPEVYSCLNLRTNGLPLYRSQHCKPCLLCTATKSVQRFGSGGHLNCRLCAGKKFIDLNTCIYLGTADCNGIVNDADVLTRHVGQIICDTHLGLPPGTRLSDFEETLDLPPCPPLAKLLRPKPLISCVEWRNSYGALYITDEESSIHRKIENLEPLEVSDEVNLSLLQAIEQYDQDLYSQIRIVGLYRKADERGDEVLIRVEGLGSGCCFIPQSGATDAGGQSAAPHRHASHHVFFLYKNSKITQCCWSSACRVQLKNRHIGIPRSIEVDREVRLALEPPHRIINDHCKAILTLSKTTTDSRRSLLLFLEQFLGSRDPTWLPETGRLYGQQLEAMGEMSHPRRPYTSSYTSMSGALMSQRPTGAGAASASFLSAPNGGRSGALSFGDSGFVNPNAVLGHKRSRDMAERRRNPSSLLDDDEQPAQKRRNAGSAPPPPPPPLGVAVRDL